MGLSEVKSSSLGSHFQGGASSSFWSQESSKGLMMATREEG